MAPATETTPDRTALPDDHPPKFLDEAKQLYSPNVAPFCSNQYFHRAGSRRTIYLAGPGGMVPEDPSAAEVEVVCRGWGPKAAFYTLDLNGERLIVKCFPGGGYGACWKVWLGVKSQYRKEVIAFSLMEKTKAKIMAKAKAKGNARASAIHEVEEAADERVNQPPSNGAEDAGATSPRDGNINLVRNQEDAVSEQNATGTSISDEVPSSGQKLNGGLDALTGDASRIANLLFECQAEQNARNKVDETLTSGADPLSTKTERPQRNIKPSKKAKIASPVSTSNPKKRRASGLTSDRDAKKQQTPATTPSTILSPAPELTTTAKTGLRQTRQSKRTSSASFPKLPRYETADSTLTPTETPIPSTQNFDSLPSLTPYKQAHTTLRVSSVASSIAGVVQLKLRSCMTPSAFFNSVLAASGYTGEGHSISAVVVTFDWKIETDIDKSTFIRRDVPDSFEIFLETVDEAPCWKEEDGRCGIAVDVVMA